MLSALLDWDFAQLIYHQNLALQNTSKNTETEKRKNVNIIESTVFKSLKS